MAQDLILRVDISGIPSVKSASAFEISTQICQALDWGVPKVGAALKNTLFWLLPWQN
jgi:hypothetical protein